MATLHDAEDLERLGSVGYRSSVVAPLLARGRVLGAITLAITDSPRRFDDADLGMIGSWGAVPFAFEGRVLGALGIAFRDPHVLRPDEREFLTAAGQLAGQALERARLYDELRRKDERLRTALFASRAGTWSVDLRTMTSQRDPSYAALFGLPRDVEASADFAKVHPDDREIARAALARTLRDGVPYEPEVRLQKGDGSYIWTRSYGQLLHDTQGPGVLTGITSSSRSRSTY